MAKGKKVTLKRWNFRRPHKYGVSKKEDRTADSITFDSKKECQRYKELCLLRKSGEVEFFLRQCPFDLGGGVKYRCDFVVFYSDGRVVFEDVKGVRTPEFIRSKKLVEDQYPVEIIET